MTIRYLDISREELASRDHQVVVYRLRTAQSYSNLGSVQEFSCLQRSIPTHSLHLLLTISSQWYQACKRPIETYTGQAYHWSTICFDFLLHDTSKTWFRQTKPPNPPALLLARISPSYGGKRFSLVMYNGSRGVIIVFRPRTSISYNKCGNAIAFPAMRPSHIRSIMDKIGIAMSIQDSKPFK